MLLSAVPSRGAHAGDPEQDLAQAFFTRVDTLMGSESYAIMKLDPA